ncbi:galactose oxidase-like domain-containing protein [Lacisediminihabitans sp.]|uniref:galactose oxidase-like domain-containing protein n=1 Tax=Lacisediminihabitans sp. TaxID=2787631 RepID=UPI00374D72E3
MFVRMVSMAAVASLALIAVAPAPADAVGVLATDVVVSTHQSAASTSVVSPAFSTTQGGELLVAFVSADGPATAGGQQFSSVTGGGITWRLRKRTNAQYGSAEVWQAVAGGILTGATVTAVHAGTYAASITVAAFTGADTTSDGAVGTASAATGAPSATLATTRTGSWVWGVGVDWDRAVARTVGSGQTKVDEFLASSGDTFWTQRQTTAGAAAPPTPATINDTAPTSDRWNLSLIEILPAGPPDTTAPVISAISSGTPTTTGTTITWTTDEPATSQVEYGATVSYGSSTSLVTALTSAHSQAIAGLTAGTTYHYRVKSADSSNNLATSPDATFTTAALVQDTTPPTVAISAPATGATVSGVIAVSATATDNQGVVGVQFTLDGATLSTEDTAAPYAAQWDTTTATAGSHTLGAVARDAAGNTASATAVSVTVNNAGTDPSVVGSWGPVQAWPEVSIHAALTNTGKILTWQGDFTQGGQQFLLDPVTGGYVQVPNAAVDLFCAGQAVLADGRILVIGGTATSGGLGLREVNAFIPGTEAWQVLASMTHPRWYPTGTTLGDGRVLVTSGSDANTTNFVPIPEIYDTQHNVWSDLSAATKTIPNYPFMYQLPDGRVLQAGASEQSTSTLALDVSTQQWTTIDGRVIDGASITNYAPGKFLKVGSASDSGLSGASASTAFTLDMNLPNPTWQPTGSMHFPRSFTNLTNLPDGTVLVTGGGTDRTGYDETKAVKPAEIWNPATGTWATVAALTAPRLYHSVALLLPDGRVWVSGSGGDAGVPDEKNYQIYSPAYLFKGARPTITAAPGTVQYNSSALIQTPNAASIQSVSLIRTGSVTHSFDQNTRALSLPFTQAAGGLNVQMPANGNLAPPGYYMLSIVDGNGVPSAASIVRFPAPYEDSVAPTAPSSLTAVGAVGRADLSWTASIDNVGVARYDIFRSTVSGFTPSPANQVGQTTGPSTTFSDSGVASGTYFYRVKAEDAAANLSPTSNEASAVVQSDTTAPTAPGNLTAVAASGQISLAWTASSDDVGVSRYNVTRNGIPVGTATGTSWVDGTVVGGTVYTYTVTAQDAAGNISSPSNSATATAIVGARTISIDKLITGHQGTSANTVSATGLTTTGSNQLLLAFVSSDGPSGVGTAAIGSVSGGGLTWTLRKRANAQPGTAEIWQAVAPGPLTNATITASQSSGSWQSAMTVVAFLNADTAPGTVVGASAASGAPTASLTTTRAGSWVWGVGTDWSAAVPRSLGANQTLVDQYLPPAGDTYWVQRQTGQTAASGTVVTVNDTAPTNDRWDLAVVEILAAP